MSSFVRVVPELSLDKAFDYAVPAELRGKLVLGSRVRVPFGNREIAGYVVEERDSSDVPGIKAVSSCIGEHPAIPPALVKLAHWMADYYIAPLGASLQAILPQAVRRKDARFKERLWVEPLSLVDAARTEEVLKRAKAQRSAWDYLNANGGGWLTDLVKASGSGLAAWRGLEQKSLVTIGPATKMRDPFGRAAEASEPLALNPDQQASLDAILAALPSADGANDVAPKAILLHGVTGSGKTEVYLRAIAETIARGRSAIVLVPEIALTPQTVERFRARFAGRESAVAVLHSHLSDGERHDQWHAIRAGKARIVIGARSAVFAPLDHLGLIVVDEEHETSYKQDDTPHYHGRDVAVMRGHLERIPVVLGSATPSLESFHNAQEKRYQLTVLPKRVEEVRLPTTHIIDMRQEFRARKTNAKEAPPPLLSRRLADAIRDRLTRREQVILFLNRRGFASSLQCPSCGHIEMSPTCSVPLTYHRRGHKLICHLSGYSKPAPASCPACGFYGFRQKGVGTQRVENAIEEAFPDARIKRMDSDSMRAKRAYEDTFDAFHAGKIDILVGTQMIAKGLHFPKVTCVGVINADQSLNMADFRASERVFQLLMQVSGRSGRGDVHGEVFVQSFAPFHPSIQFARHHDYDGFADQELEFRRALGYPPYRRAVLVTWRGRDEPKTHFVAQNLTKTFRAALEGTGADVPDPAPAPIEMINEMYRFHLFIRADKARLLEVTRRLRPHILDAAGAGRRHSLPDGVRMSLDVDPTHLL